MSQDVTTALGADGKEPIKPESVVITRESLEAKAKASKDAWRAYDGNDPKAELSLQMQAYKDTQAIVKYDAEIASKAEAEKAEAAKAERMAEIDTLISLHEEARVAASDKKLTLDEKNVINNKYKDWLNHVKENYVSTMKRTIVVPQGMSGKSLEKSLERAITGNGEKQSGSGKEISDLLDAGKGYAELIAAGYTDGNIRSIMWKKGIKKSERP